jgi:Helix-turn-helix domain
MNGCPSIKVCNIPMAWDEEHDLNGPEPQPVTDKYLWLKMIFQYTPPRDAHLRAVCYSIADHANKDGYCWPSIEAIQFEAAVAENTALNRIDQLVATGFIVKSKRRQSGATWRHNAYQLAVPISLIMEYKNLEGAIEGEKNGDLRPGRGDRYPAARSSERSGSRSDVERSRRCPAARMATDYRSWQ